MFSTANRICRCIELEMQDAHLTETQQSLRPIRPEYQQRQRQNQQFKRVMVILQRDTGKPASSVFIFNFAVAHFAMANQLELMATQEFQKIDGSVDRTPTHITHLCSTVCSQAWNAHHALDSSQTDCFVIFARLKKVSSSDVAHVLPFVVLPPAVYHEHITFFIHSYSSFYHNTRTHSTLGTTRTTPRTPSTSRISPSFFSRQAASSRITLT